MASATRDDAVAVAQSMLGVEHPDLRRERAGSAVPVRRLTYLLDGGKAKTLTRERMANIVECDPVFDNTDRIFASRSERFFAAWKKMRHLQVRRRELRLSDDEFALMQRAVNDYLPSLLNDFVFYPAVMSQASDEQQKAIFGKSRDHRILGCYCQTELGHGSNVRGLETTATFIPETGEWDLHSPTLTSTKWWVGALGRTATHAVVYARMLLPAAAGSGAAAATGSAGYKDMGVHSFFVQLRDLDTHEPLPGRTIGDLGPKLGFNTIDNGFLRLHHVRIPRTDLLSRFVNVSPEGVFSKPPHAKAAYGAMVYVRSGMVQNGGATLARAVTIAVRYSCVRRQGFQKGGKASAGAAGRGRPRETQVLDYATQQYALMPLLATAYAYHFTAEYMVREYSRLSEGTARGDLSSMTSVHVLSSGLKSLVTSSVADGIEVCRKACGGHGYSKMSGLPELYCTYVHEMTAEGEATLLTQQTTRALLRAFMAPADADAEATNMSYLAGGAKAVLGSPCRATGGGGDADDALLLSAGAQLAALRARAAVLVGRAAQSIGDAKAAGASDADAWNAALVEIAAASRAHCVAVVAASFCDAVDRVASRASGAASAGAGSAGDAPDADEAPTAELVGALTRLRQLYCLFNMEAAAAELLESGHYGAAVATRVRALVRAMCADLRGDAVALVDAWGFSDAHLASALGRYDGQAYAALYLWAQREPLNQPGAIDAAYREHLNPLLHARL